MLRKHRIYEYLQGNWEKLSNMCGDCENLGVPIKKAISRLTSFAADVLIVLIIWYSAHILLAVNVLPPFTVVSTQGFP